MVKNTDIHKNHFLLAGASSGVGKTTIVLGLLRALYNRGLSVSPMKCGPDYIDPTYHNDACHRKSRNLDTWMMGENGVKRTYERALASSDTVIVEGVMGLFDGATPRSLAGSSADIAQTLNLPVILAVDAKGMAASIAAQVKGYSELVNGVNVVGVIANRVGSKKHADILAEALEFYNLPPLIGYLPRSEDFLIPERHLGLVPSNENKMNSAWYDKLAESCEKHIDIDRLLKLTEIKGEEIKRENIQNRRKADLRVGIALDEAFHFYYEDNLDLLREAGIELVKFSPLKDKVLPENLSALYIGGGFPEVYGEKLSSNSSIINEIRAFASEKRPIYAECGGLMYLSQSLVDHKGEEFEMCSLLPCTTKMEKRLKSLGYREVRLLSDCLIGNKDELFRGHEFHFSSSEELHSDYKKLWSASDSKGKAIGGLGFKVNNILGSYIHIHFASNPKVVEKIREFLLS